MRIQLTLICLVGLVLSVMNKGLEAQSSWTRIVPGQTTETQLIERFGIPDIVDLFWRDFVIFRSKATPPAVRFYQLKYSAASTNTDLVNGGPFGRAFETTVAVGFDQVITWVEWRYFEGYHYTPGGRQVITRSEIEKLAGGKSFSVTKHPSLSDDAASFEFVVGKQKVRVLFIGEGSDIIARVY